MAVKQPDQPVQDRPIRIAQKRQKWGHFYPKVSSIWANLRKVDQCVDVLFDGES